MRVVRQLADIQGEQLVTQNTRLKGLGCRRQLSFTKREKKREEILTPSLTPGPTPLWTNAAVKKDRNEQLLPKEGAPGMRYAVDCKPREAVLLLYPDTVAGADPKVGHLTLALGCHSTGDRSELPFRISLLVFVCRASPADLGSADQNEIPTSHVT